MANANSDQSHLITSAINDENSVQTPSGLEDQFNLLSVEHQSNITDLEQNLNNNNNYASSNNTYESENDSDTHDEHPFEAIDDSILPNESRVDSDEKISFHPQPSRDRDDDFRSPVEETQPSEDNYSSVVVDFDSIRDPTSTESTSVVYKQSLCEPCTIAEDDIVNLKQTSTITTTITTKCSEPKKDKNDLGHIMISYNHSTKVLCTKIAKELKDRNYPVWIDQDNISGNILDSMASAVDNSFVVLMAINEKYYTSRYCRLEAEYSLEFNKASIPMLMQKDYKASGWLGIMNGAKLHIDFVQLSFDEAFQQLVREIENIRRLLGADEHSQSNICRPFHCTQAITTMSSCLDEYQDVMEWNANDVVEWLDREKLEIFQNALMNFTGATLWQLYKIKYDSPADYFRTVESLLPPTVPLRIFYNLTFHGAIELLFAKSNPHRKY